MGLTEATVRPMTPADVPAVAALEAAAHQAPRPAEVFADELDLPHAYLWVLALGEALLGFIDCWVVADEVEVLDVVVDPGARRKGHARRLLSHALACARARGAQTAHLEVRVSNTAAQALYTSFGFVEVGRRRRYYPDGEDASLWSSSLSGSSAASTA